MQNQTERKLYEQVLQEQPYVTALRRYFHKHPELSAKEYHTAEKIEEELDKLGISHRRVGDTGVYAELTGDNPEGRTIVLRADMDALPVTEEHICEYTSQNPGVMHACGHDAHTASLLGAARVLSANRSLFSGTVRFAFQQGEEIGYGARLFVDGGFLEGADRTFGIHVASDVDAGKAAVVPGPNNASVDWFKIRVQGKAAHVSTPQRGVDALYIASQIVVAAQALITRRTSPMDNVLIGIGKMTAGTGYNIVAQEAELEGTIRVLTEPLRRETKERLEQLAASIAQTFGGSVSFTWKDFTSPLVNDTASAEEVQRTAAALFGGDKVITRREPTLGGDDFAEFILQVPGAYAYVGSRNPQRPETCVAHHNAHFDVDEDALRVATALYTVYAADYLNGWKDI